MDLKTRKGVKSIGIIGFVLILIAGFVLVLQPLFEQNGKFVQQISAAEAEQNSVNQKLEMLRFQKSTIVDVEKLDDELSKQFPGASNTPGLVSMISEAAVKSGLNSKNLTNLTAGIPTITATTSGTDAAAPPTADTAAGTPAAAAPGAASNSNVAEIAVSINLEGDIESLSNFASQLKNTSRNLTVVSFNISNDEQGKATASVDAKTYIYKSIDKVVAPDGEAPVTPVEEDK